MPGGYVVYGEIPFPEGSRSRANSPILQFALYGGHTNQAPLLLASTKAVPLTGQQVDKIHEPRRSGIIDATGSNGTELLFVVRTSGIAGRAALRPSCRGILGGGDAWTAFWPPSWSCPPSLPRTRR